MSIPELLETYKQKYHTKFSYNLSLTHNVLEAHVFFDDFEILSILEVDSGHAYYVSYYKPRKNYINYYALKHLSTYNFFLQNSYSNIYYIERSDEYDTMLNDIKEHIEYSYKSNINYSVFKTELEKLYEELKKIEKIKPMSVEQICQKRIDILKDTYGDFLT